VPDPRTHPGLVSPGDLPIDSWTPEPERGGVSAVFCRRYFEPAADGSSTLSPDEEQFGGVIDDCPLKFSDALAILIV
jgi:hypothetical protein